MSMSLSTTSSAIGAYDIECRVSILDRGAPPVVIGGDHSISFPNVCAFSQFSPLDIIHIDAHLDWRDNIDGVRFANAMPLREM